MSDNPIYITAAHKSSGKTTITLGISAALTRRSYSVQVFKKGPDYIDPLWHGRASARPCYNLDFNVMTDAEILNRYKTKSQSADISIIEGNLGLFDGMDIHGSDSNAAMAKLLNAKIILVLDCNGVSRGIAPLILGYQQFDRELTFSGIILNQVAGKRHESKLREVIHYYTDLPVLGAVHKNKELQIKERHLGLIPSNEAKENHLKLKTIENIINEQLEIETIIQLAGISSKGNKADFTLRESKQNKPAAAKIQLGIFQDSAFGFYYPSDLEALNRYGAELIPINALKDKQLPDNLDALFIGGGFPETRMQNLAANQSLKSSVYDAIYSGMPAYAECGGMMYLCKEIIWDQKSAQMVGLIPAIVEMKKRPQGRGLIRYRETTFMPWDKLSKQHDEQVYNAHEFHFSCLSNIDTSQINFAYHLERGNGIQNMEDGIVYKNLLASYAHLQDTEQNHWAQRFINFIKKIDYRRKNDKFN